MVHQHAHQTSAAQQLIEVYIGILLGGHCFVVLLVVIHFYTFLFIRTILSKIEKCLLVSRGFK